MQHVGHALDFEVAAPDGAVDVARLVVEEDHVLVALMNPGPAQSVLLAMGTTGGAVVERVGGGVEVSHGFSPVLQTI